MGTRHLIDTLVADLDPIARPVVTAYLRELAAALPGPRSAREAILAEIGDGLNEQIIDTAGPDPAATAETAIRRFGSPVDLAAQFARELTGMAAHRAGFALVVSGPLIGACWLLAVAGGQPALVTGTVPERIAGLFTAVPLIPMLLLIIVPAALVAAAGAGVASRILPVGTRAAGVAAVLAGTGCVFLDVTVIGYGVTTAAAWSPLLIAAVTVSTARLGLAAAAARRCARLLVAG